MSDKQLLERGPVALPFAIFENEMAALRRFHECVMDGDGYDVEQELMERLSGIGLVRRVKGRIYEATNFGLSVLNGDFDAPPSAAPVQEPVANAKAIAECLAVLRPLVKRKFPQEQALEELAGYLATPPAAPVQEPVAWAGWHTSTDEMMLFKTKAEAVSWRDQYKKGFASIEGLVRPFLPAAPVRKGNCDD